MTVSIVFAPGTANELTIDESDIQSYNPVLTHTGKGDCPVTTRELRSLDEYAKRQDRVNIKIDGSVAWTGYIIGSNHNRNSALSSLRFDGIAKRLEETRPDYQSIGGPLVYTDIALDDAIDDYWGRTPFSNYSVTDQNTEPVATDENVQSLSSNSDWSSAVSIANTDPFAVQNNRLETLQTCFTTEAEDGTLNGTDSLVRNEYSGSTATAGAGQAEGLSELGDSIEWTFNLGYIVSNGNWGWAVRWDAADQTDVPEIEWSLDGNALGTYSPQTLTSIGNPQWEMLVDNGRISDPGGVSAGSHTLKAEVTTAGTETWYIDVIAPYDRRYNYTFDNTTTTGSDDGSYLDGPELYPDNVQLTFDDVDVSFNVTGARIDSAWIDSNTVGNQAISLSNDGGSTYITTNNSETADVSFTTTAGRTVTQRITADRYPQGTSPQNDTPRFGYNGQGIDTWDLYVDGDNLVVIDRLELSRNHFENLKTLHNYGNFLWVIEHDSSDIANMTVSSFQEGDETRVAPTGFDDPSNQNSEVKADNYFNVIPLQGAEPDTGTRPFAEVKADQSVINNDGREISPGILRDQDITTEAGALFRARSLLDAAQSNNDLVGSVTVPPIDGLTNPGYARPIDLGDGTADKTVEEVSFSESNGSIQATYRFSLPNDLAENLNQLKQGQRQLGDTV